VSVALLIQHAKRMESLPECG